MKRPANNLETAGQTLCARIVIRILLQLNMSLGGYLGNAADPFALLVRANKNPEAAGVQSGPEGPIGGV